jgi:hypothetical protein
VALLRGLFGQKAKPVQPAPPALVVDDTFGDPDAVAVRAALAEGDWVAARAILARDWDGNDYRFLVDQAAMVQGIEEWLPDIIRDEPDDTLPQVLYGARAVTWAWEARTGAWARNVTPDRARLFLQRLAIAEDILQDVVRRDPSDTAAWTTMITVALGLSMPIDEKRRRFEQATAPDPTNVKAHRAMLKCLCEKWGGSHAAMHDFARTAAYNAPPGSRLGGLMAEAHAENWLLSGPNSATYYNSTFVLDELMLAAKMSVLHPDYVAQTGWPVEFNYFAHGLSLAGAHSTARQMFEAIGDHVTELPWAWLKGGDPVAAFTRRRAVGYT